LPKVNPIVTNIIDQINPPVYAKSLRESKVKQSEYLEKVADIIFLIAILIVFAITFLIAFFIVF